MAARIDEDRWTPPGLLWRFPLLSGLAAIIIGAYLIYRPQLTGLAVLQALALLWLIEGIYDLITAVMMRGRHWGWTVVVGVLDVLAGLIIILHPVLGAAVLLTFLFYLLVIWAVINGIIDIVTGLQQATRSWTSVFLGAVKILVGLMLLEYPLQGTLSLIPTLGVLLVIAGVVLVFSAFWVRGRVESAFENRG